MARVPAQAEKVLDARPSVERGRFIARCMLAAGANPEEVWRGVLDRQSGSGRLPLEDRWYASLARGEPDYTIYADQDYLSEAWYCWVWYSRLYLLALRKRAFPKKMLARRVYDLGCGIGYTTAALAQMWPDAEVIGTQFAGTYQDKVARSMAHEFGFFVEVMATEQADVVFASEYFEHFERPIDHLEQVLTIVAPRVLIVANAFSAKSAGHFDEYIVNDERIDPARAARAFSKTMRQRGYHTVSTPFWNSRPTVWARG